MVNLRLLELQVAKQILQEIFHALALGRRGDDPDEARREELEQGELARRRGAMAKRVLPG